MCVLVSSTRNSPFLSPFSFYRTKRRRERSIIHSSILLLLLLPASNTINWLPFRPLASLLAPHVSLHGTAKEKGGGGGDGSPWEKQEEEEEDRGEGPGDPVKIEIRIRCSDRTDFLLQTGNEIRRAFVI